MQPLVQPADLDGFPGGPFTPAVVNAAAESVRIDAGGWHIAPLAHELIVLAGQRRRELLLPTRRIAEVLSVTVDGRVLAADEYLVHAGEGILERLGWHWGSGKVVVDLIHGYESCPADLLAVVAERARNVKRGGRVKSESLGGRSVSLETSGPGLALGSGVPSRYVLVGF